MDSAKWIAETTQVSKTESDIAFGMTSDSLSRTQNFITLMDALKLKLRAKDQLHPILSELMSSYAKLNKSSEWEGRPKILQWYVPRRIRLP